jgi:hypothetical protein
MERCPICRARFKDDPLCYRSGSDLTRLLCIETEAAAQERHAIVLLNNHRIDAARHAAEQALALKYSPLAAALLQFLSQDLLITGNADVKSHFPVQDQGL